MLSQRHSVYLFYSYAIFCLNAALPAKFNEFVLPNCASQLLQQYLNFLYV